MLYWKMYLKASQKRWHQNGPYIHGLSNTWAWANTMGIFCNLEKAATELLKVVTFVFSVPISTPTLSVYSAIWRISGQTKGTGCQWGWSKQNLKLNKTLNYHAAFIEGLLQAAKRDEQYTWKRRWEMSVIGCPNVLSYKVVYNLL